MAIRERMSGNEAVAVAMRQINPDVVAAFPITPSTEVPQYFSTFFHFACIKFITQKTSASLTNLSSWYQSKAAMP